MTHMVRIFFKDIRYLSSEIYLILLLISIWVALRPIPWTLGHFTVAIVEVSIWLMLPLIWAVAIARLIHSDSIVGERQFWKTRPYTWTILLGSKLLFISVFILLPFFLALCSPALYHAQGFEQILPDALQKVLALVLLFVLPTASIASVTENLFQFMMVSLGTLVAIGTSMVFSIHFSHRYIWLPHRNEVFALFIAAVTFGSLVYQYATRRTKITYRLLIATPTLLFFASLFIY